MELSKKALNMSTSLTLALTAKATELRSKGLDIISFSAGEPDFNTPENVRQAAARAMEEGKSKYTATAGIKELRSLICKKFKEDNNLNYEENNIIVSTGAKQCLSNVFLAILNPGDEVIIASPYWVSYPELISLADGKPVFVETKKENSFKFTKEELEKSITKKTKAIVLNSPNNPTGAIYSKAELEDILEFAKKYDLFIISDEIYEKLNYVKDKKEHISIASLSEDALNRTIVINGFSKAYAMTGWRIGYAAGNSEVIKLMTTIQSHTTSNVNSIAQYAAVEALAGEQKELENMINIFSERRNLMVSLIEGIEGFDFINPEGAFYCFIDVSKYFQGNIKNSMDFATKLLEKENVVVIPGVAFGKDNYIRLSYATSEENIITGIERIKNFVNSLV
ncbi:pyridoxal phosphate-dependent aminotransferase [Clostridium mediterraneense]|uniref:pyridoxal phosphate-dependent aminotransferase n=1 Tax=Clostridium mediterraneense TaxID=1805472 RepID=UPI000836E231|nr:pyridoxal phosphate-dependent aminotransferase [Clostridium mediterraneense]